MTILLATAAAFMLVPVAQAFANGTMTVNVVGTGSGEVSSVGGWIGEGFWEGEPPIACSGPPSTGTCVTELVEEAEEPGVEAISFTAATPGTNSELVAFIVEEGFDFGTGCEELIFEGGGACTVGQETGAGNAEVTAVFECEEGKTCEEAPAGPPLKLTIEEGSGTVATNPAGEGFPCTGAAPKTCESTEFAENSIVTLTASPAPGYVFKSWKKCDPLTAETGVNGRQCKVKMSAAKEVGAKFVKTWDLTASKAAGSGPGKLSTKPAGVVCLFNCSSTTAAYKEDGKTIEVVAVPYKHFHLEEFSAATGSASSCTGETSCSFVIGEDSSIEALFAEDPKFALSVAKEGGGTGIVKSKPGGILCSYTCSAVAADFYEGEVVAVSWKLGKGTGSIEWSSGAGTCTGTSVALEGSCSVTMSAAKSLVAKFE